MKKILVSAVVAAGIVGSAATAGAGSRADSYYTVVCGGIAYESIDAHAVDLGGKDAALARFPRADCELTGPHNP